MSVLEAGEYRLENVRQATLALLSDLSPGTPLRANYKQDDKSDIVSELLPLFSPM